MTFDEFQNRARLYVIGALYPDELELFTKARDQFGPKAETFLRECYALHEAFALSLRPVSSRDAVKRRLMSMTRKHMAA